MQTNGEEFSVYFFGMFVGGGASMMPERTASEDVERTLGDANAGGHGGPPVFASPPICQMCAPAVGEDPFCGGETMGLV